MPIKMSRADIDAQRGIKQAAPAPAAPANDLAAITKAVASMSQAIAESARLAADAQASVAAILGRKISYMEADIARDQEGRMSKVIITTRKE